MKVIKLNKTHCSEVRGSGFTYALRFDYHNDKAVAVEKLLRAKVGGHGWWIENPWYIRYGHSKNSKYRRPYWIYFRDEKLITMVLLMVDSVA